MVPERSRPALIAVLALVMVLAGGCGGDEREALPPAPVDLLPQADAAAEVIHVERLQRHLEELTGPKRAAYVAAELRRLGYRPGAPDGDWRQDFDVPRRSVQAGPWELRRGEAQLVLEPGTDFVAALGAQATTVRLGGRDVVFADRGLTVPGGSLAGKVVMVLSPAPGAGAVASAAPPSRPAEAAPSGADARPGGAAATQPRAQPSPPAAGPAAGPLPELFRRAAGAGAVAVVLLPPPGSAAPLPDPVAAGELAAGSGLPLALWVTDAAARELLATLASTGLGYLPQLEARRDILPLAMGEVARLAVEARTQRDRHFNVVGVLPARPGGLDEAIALVAPLGGAGDHDPRSEAAALAQLLAVAAGCQAVSDPPRRTLVIAAVDSSGDGTQGARRLLPLAGEGGRFAAAVVFAGGNLRGPTADLTFVGLQASPLAGLAQRVAGEHDRHLGADPAPGRGLLWRSPAWGFLDAGVPAVLLEPGAVPRSTSAPGGLGLAAASPPRAATTPENAGTGAPGTHTEGMAEDARIAFRLVLELLETQAELPRVDPAQVTATLRSAAAAPVPTPELPPRQRVAGRRPGAAGGTAPPGPVAEVAPPAGGGTGTGADGDDSSRQGVAAAPPRQRTDESVPREEPGDAEAPAAPSFLAPIAAPVPPPLADPPSPAPADEDEPAAAPPPRPTAPPEGEPDPTGAARSGGRAAQDGREAAAA
jgi:hypothetical protein